MAGERLGDLAEILAHHATSVLHLARAAGQAEGRDEMESEAVRYLQLAAARALALDVAKAEAQLSLPTFWPFPLKGHRRGGT